MWHEARQQEKKIREVMVDFQKRAERRREHYEKMVDNFCNLMYYHHIIVIIIIILLYYNVIVFV